MSSSVEDIRLDKFVLFALVAAKGYQLCAVVCEE
jgi:hypothetical protein